MARVVCPKCGRLGTLSVKKVKGKDYCYVAHKDSGKVKWCYVGRGAEEPLEDAGASKVDPVEPMDAAPSRPDRGQASDEAEEYLARLRAWSSKPEYTDEELLKAIVKEARSDYFCGTGRIFIDEFCRWYGCTRERLFAVLDKSGLKWRPDVNGVVVLINL